MAITITDDLLATVQMSDDELLVDLACYLYDRERLSIGKASKLCGLNRVEFQQALAARNIYIKYNIDDFNLDMKNLGLRV